MPLESFGGCRNYRKEGESCQHTENEIVFDERLKATQPLESVVLDNTAQTI